VRALYLLYIESGKNLTRALRHITRRFNRSNAGVILGKACSWGSPWACRQLKSMEYDVVLLVDRKVPFVNRIMSIPEDEHLLDWLLLFR